MHQRQVIDARQQHCCSQRRRCIAAATLTGQVARYMHCASRLTTQHDARRITAIIGDDVEQPVDRTIQVGGTRRPGMSRCQTIGQVDTHIALTCRPNTHVVVKRRIGCALVTLYKATAVHIDEHRAPRCRRGDRRKNIETVPLIRTIGQITLNNTDLRIGHLD